MIAYIIAGAILGFYAIEFAFAFFKANVPLEANLLMAFVGGVAGHLVHTLLFN